MTIEILRIGADFERYEELLDVILAAFASMDGRIDPPSSAHRLTPASLRQKAAQEIAFAAVEKGQLVGCIFLKPEEATLYIGKLAVHPAAQGKGIGRLLFGRRKRRPGNWGLPASGWRPASNSPRITGSLPPGALPGRRKAAMPAMTGRHPSRCASRSTDGTLLRSGSAARGSAGDGRRNRCGC